MDSTDAFGAMDWPSRIAADVLLSEAEDEVLQAIVSQAAAELSVPIALVNLLLEQVQFFKAHHGLPKDLQAARGTDRNASFCQFVVRDGQPFEVVDAKKDDRIPQHLVRHYGIQAYLGMPITVKDTTIGSLCVIDTKPRSFSDEDRRKLRELAERVNAQLAILTVDKEGKLSDLKDQYLTDASSKLLSALSFIEEEIPSGKSAATAIGVFLRLMDHDMQHQVVPRPVIEQMLVSGREALSSCRETLNNIEIHVAQIRAGLKVLENIRRLKEVVRLPVALEESVQLMHPLLSAVGGIRVSTTNKLPHIRLSQPQAVSVISTSLSLLAARLVAEKGRGGVQAVIRQTEQALGLSLQAPELPEENFHQLAEALRHHLGTSAFFTVGAGKGSLEIHFAMHPTETGVLEEE